MRTNRHFGERRARILGARRGGVGRESGHIAFIQRMNHKRHQTASELARDV
jgi:hypothetical protein